MIYVLRNHLWHIFRHDWNISRTYYRTFYWQLADIIRDKPWRWRYRRDRHLNTFLHDRDLVSIGSYLISHHMKINWYNKTAENYFVHTFQMVFGWLRLTGSGRLWHKFVGENGSFVKKIVSHTNRPWWFWPHLIEFTKLWPTLDRKDSVELCRHLNKKYQKWPMTLIWLIFWQVLIDT